MLSDQENNGSNATGLAISIHSLCLCRSSIDLLVKHILFAIDYSRLSMFSRRSCMLVLLNTKLAAVFCGE